jgi:tetratricopeptide (TPR) repeat protein
MKQELAEIDQMIRRGTALAERGAVAEAVQTLEEALDRARRNGEREAEAIILLDLGAIYSADLRQPREAAARWQEALAIARADGNLQIEASCLANLGSLLDECGQPEQALGYLEQALEIARQPGVRVNEDVVVQMIANAKGHLRRG